jgi:metal-dependent amidase/aminoacylase/carboxypeptidase family protein
VVTVGQFHAGTKRTIIPEIAQFELTVRTVDDHVRGQIASAVVEICENVARAHRVEATVVWREEFDLTVNDCAQAGQAAAVTGELYGADRVIGLAQPVMGSEDFSRILAAVPGAMVFLGACPPGIDSASRPTTTRRALSSMMMFWATGRCCAQNSRCAHWRRPDRW